MLNIRPITVLVMATQPPPWLNHLLEKSYDVHETQDPVETIKNLREYDIVLIEDSDKFDIDVLELVSEVRRREPLMALFVITQREDPAELMPFLEAGATNTLGYKVDPEHLIHQMRVSLRQRRQSTAFVDQYRSIRIVMRAMWKLHMLDNAESFVFDALDILCETMGLYGATLVLDEGMYNLYSANSDRELPDIERHYKSAFHPEEHNPYLRVMSTDVLALYDDIRVDPYYIPPPVLLDAEAGLILPVKYQGEVIGALGAFTSASRRLQYDDIELLEPFVDHFAIAYDNLQKNVIREKDVRTSRHLLNAWQTLDGCRTSDDVLNTLRDLINALAVVEDSLIWLYGDFMQYTEPVIAKGGSRSVEKVFEEIYEQGDLGDVIEKMMEDLKPVRLWVRHYQERAALQLFQEMNADYLVVIPIADQTIIGGGVALKLHNNTRLTDEDTNLLEGLMYAALYAVQRIIFIRVLSERTQRMELILRSISEGMFFVDERDRVSFCNPQFTEMTGLQPSEVINYSSEALLHRMAKTTEQYTDVLRDFKSAVTRLPHEGEYPIVEFTQSETNSTLLLELVALERKPDNEQMTWIGVVRDGSRYPGTRGQAAAAGGIGLLQNVIDHIRIPEKQLRGTVDVLLEQDTNMNANVRQGLLKQLRDQLKQIDLIWDNVTQMQRLEGRKLTLSVPAVDLYTLMQDVFDSRYLNRLYRHFDFSLPDASPQVVADVPALSQAFINLYVYILGAAAPRSRIQIQLVQRRGQVAVLLTNPSPTGAVDVLAQGLNEGADVSGDNLASDVLFNLYVTREILAAHGGGVVSRQESDGSFVVEVTLADESSPAQEEPVVVQPASPNAKQTQVVTEVSEGQGARATTSQNVFVFKGRSQLTRTLTRQLEGRGYVLMSYTSPEDGLANLDMTRLGLIVVDAEMANVDIPDLCQRIREKTSVPIVVVTDREKTDQEIEALNRGADDYIAMPITDEQLTARVNVIINRTQLPDRVQEPMRAGDLVIDFSRRQVFLKGDHIELTRIEYELLRVLALNAGQVLTHKQLLAKVWGPEYRDETHYLWVNISRLRRKIEEDPSNPRYIQNIPGIGYMFSGEE